MKMITTRQEYFMSLLEGRAKRLTDLIESAAPESLICHEVILLLQAAVPLNPKTFKSWAGNYCWPAGEVEYENRFIKSATG